MANTLEIQWLAWLPYKLLPISLDKTVTQDIQRITGQHGYHPQDPKELAQRLFTTCYMGSQNSSEDTKACAAGLAKDIGR